MPRGNGSPGSYSRVLFCVLPIVSLAIKRQGRHDNYGKHQQKHVQHTPPQNKLFPAKLHGNGLQSGICRKDASSGFAFVRCPGYAGMPFFAVCPLADE
jgi:hypothetical protein